MKAYLVTDPALPPQMTDSPVPTPAAGEVLLDLRACAINFADLLMVKGEYQERPALPFAPGMEMAGIVRDPGSSGLPIGARVAAFAGHGGLAEAAVVPADRCLLLPDAMPFDVAAALPVAYGTSHLALDHRARLQPGETLVVTGAAGGVGLTAVELGKRMGARVIAIARGAAKLEVAQAAGADHLIDADAKDIKDQLKALGGIDVAYDAVGGALFDACFRAAKPQARLLVIGFAGGDLPQIRPNHLLVKNVSVIGHYWGGYTAFAPHILMQSLRTLMDWWSEGGLHPHISHLVPLERAADAMELVSSRRSTGKVVVQMG